MITGALFVELIFGIPGFAGISIQAFQARDYPMILATTLIGSFLTIATNLMVDVGYGFLDPRVRIT
jgi:ABC-type dipeptide/oligopeptide/nickel transport system permease component